MKFTKIIRLEDHFPTGEPTVQLVRPGRFCNIKTASEATEYIKDVKPERDKTFILVLAVSAGEFYGQNKNGDAFAENPIPGIVEAGQTIIDKYKTFEKGHFFQHHTNKNPDKAIGNVIKAFYNLAMHRVELLLALDNLKAPDLIDKIESGKYIPVSMGCRIKYDVCSRRGCHNRAPTREQYCDHAKLHLNEVDPHTGESNFVWNPDPEWFDISAVFRPADKLGFMMKKVAYELRESSADLGSYVVSTQEKLSNIKKLSEMTKQITGGEAISTSHLGDVVSKAVSNTEELPSKAIDELAKHPLPVAMSTLNAAGIMPTCVEIHRIIIRKVNPDHKVPKEVELRMGGLQDKIFDMLKEFPEILEALEKAGLTKLSQDLVDPELLKSLGPLQEKRSNLRDYIYRRTIGDPHPNVGQWQPMTIDSPTGTYQTTRGAVNTAQDTNLERQAKVMGGSALLSGAAYKLLTKGRGKYLAPLTAGGLLMGNKLVHDVTKVPDFYGTDIPINTEMSKIGSDVDISAVTNSASLMMLAQEYKQANVKFNSLKEMLKPYQDALTKAAKYNPVIAQLCVNDFDAVASMTKQAYDSVYLNAIDLEGVCYWLGSGLYD